MHDDETDDDARERLNQLRPQLQAEGYDPVGPYRDLWQQALNGVFPATQKRAMVLQTEGHSGDRPGAETEEASARRRVVATHA